MAIETVKVTDHAFPGWRNLMNPIWWLQTGGPGSTWTAPRYNGTIDATGKVLYLRYLPNIENQFLRNLYWWLRNPCGNFVGYVIGFEGVNYDVTGPAPALATTWRDVGATGFKWAILWPYHIPVPFVSYAGAHWELYFGWRPASGGFGTKIVRHK